ncbi:Histidinol dehydrogenase, partial [Crocosphaera watsonii WH 0003]
MTAKDLATVKRRAELDIDQVIPIAQEVITAIAQTGDKGLIEYAQKFDYTGATPENIKVTPEEFEQAQ